MSPDFPSGRQTALDSCVNMTMKYSEIGRERRQVEDVRKKRRSGDHLILLPSAPCQIFLFFFLEGSTLSGYFLRYICRKQIIDIRFDNITNLAANGSSVLRSLSSPCCCRHPSPLSLYRSSSILLSWSYVGNTSHSVFNSRVLLFSLCTISHSILSLSLDVHFTHSCLSSSFT